MLATALEVDPVLRLIPNEAAVAAAAALVARTGPAERLHRQHAPAPGALSYFDSFKVPFVVAGAAAALLQGFPTPVNDLHLVVQDSNDALVALEGLLRAHLLLFDELDPDSLRPIVEKSWAIGECEVRISLAEPLPDSVAVELAPGYVVRALTPQALLADPEVASILRMMPVPSSDREQSGFAAF
jgi:hypothetical protein